jgi:hypothetical protein
MKKALLVVLAGVVACAFIGCGPSQGQVELEKLYKDANAKLSAATKTLKDAKTADEAAKAMEAGTAALKDTAKKEEALLKQYPNTKENDSLKKLQGEFEKVSKDFAAQFEPVAKKFAGDKKILDAMEKISKM